MNVVSCTGRPEGPGGYEPEDRGAGAVVMRRILTEHALDCRTHTGHIAGRRVDDADVSHPVGCILGELRGAISQRQLGHDHHLGDAQALTHTAQPPCRSELREAERQLRNDDPERVAERERDGLRDAVAVVREES